jgi:hypothetical protein
MDAMIRLCEYLLATSELCLLFAERNHHRDLVLLYTDAEWASDTLDRRSQTGIVLFHYCGVVVGRSQRQESKSNSSTESEVIALGGGTREAMFLDKLMLEIEEVLPEIIIYEDNKGAKDVCERNSICSKLKHVSVQHFITGEYLEKRKQVSTTEQFVDIMTKALEGEDFLVKRGWINIRDPRELN